MKKASIDSMVLITLVSIVIITMFIVYLVINSGAKESKRLEVSYSAIQADVAVQGIMEDFEKTALFFGMMKTENELGAHGGVSLAVVGNADALKPKMYVESGIPYLAPVSCDTCTGGTIAGYVYGGASIASYITTNYAWCGRYSCTTSGGYTVPCNTWYSSTTPRGSDGTHCYTDASEDHPNSGEILCGSGRTGNGGGCAAGCGTAYAVATCTKGDVCAVSATVVAPSPTTSSFYSAGTCCPAGYQYYNSADGKCYTTHTPILRCPDGSDGCKTKKRMPFLYYADKYTRFGTVTPFKLVVGGGKYSLNLAEVANNEYDLHVLAQVFLLKPGKVDLKACQSTRCATESVTETGFAEIDLGSAVVNNNNDDITFTAIAESDDAAVLREVAVSIYDMDVVESPNKLLNESINDYQKKMSSFPKDSFTLKINPLEATFIPAGKGVYGALDEQQGFLGGIAWAPAGISAESPDVYTSSAGIAEEDAKIRYWRMYGFADYFVDNLDVNGIVKPRILNKLESFADYYTKTTSGCGSVKCPGDTTSTYSVQKFSDALNNGISDLVVELNKKYTDEGFSWSISIDGITGANTQHTPYSWKHQWSGDCCATDEDGGCIAVMEYCTMKYAHEYGLKNVKLLVEITDDKYRYFNSTTNTWEKPVFKFYVELDNVDDNYCDGYYCNTFGGGATLPAIPAPIVPKYP